LRDFLIEEWYGEVAGSVGSLQKEGVDIWVEQK
jgi:hypothetical protein